LALLAFDRALAHDRDAPEVVYRRASYLLSIDQIPEAVSELQRATTLGSARDRCRAWYGLDLALGPKRTATRLAAVAHLSECAETVSELARAAENFLEEGNLEQATRLADRAVARDPGYRVGYSVRGRVHRKAGRLELAVSDLRRALSLVPDGMNPYPAAEALGEALAALSAQRGTKRTE
jgi:Tfp pilus assembly protein PilF